MGRWIKARWFPVVLLPALYLASRLATLGTIPLFHDEAVYLRWAARIGLEGERLDISLRQTGVQPLLIWVAAPVLRFGGDPLVVGRVLSVLVNLAGLAGLYWLGQELAGRWAGLIAAAAYLLLPMALVYDWLFLSETILVAIAPWLWLCGVRHLRSGSGASLCGLAMLCLLGYVAKTSVLVVAASAAMGLAAGGGRLRRLVQAWAAMAVGAAGGMVALWPWSASIAGHDYRVARRPAELLELPWQQVGTALLTHLGWLLIYLTPVVCLLALVLSIWGMCCRQRPLRWVASGLIAELLLLAVAVRTELLNPRYLVIAVPVFCIVIGVGLVQVVSNRVLRRLLLAAALVPAGCSSLVLVINPVRAWLPATERFQLLTGWPSGWGVRELLHGLVRAHGSRPFGLLASGPLSTEAARLYLPPDWVVSDRQQELGQAAKILGGWIGQRPCYLLANDSGPASARPGLRLRRVVEKPGGLSAFRLYSIPAVRPPGGPNY